MSILTFILILVCITLSLATFQWWLTCEDLRFRYMRAMEYLSWIEVKESDLDTLIEQAAAQKVLDDAETADRLAGNCPCSCEEDGDFCVSNKCVAKRDCPCHWNLAKSAGCNEKECGYW